MTGNTGRDVGTHHTPPGQYNVFCINNNEMGEMFTVEVTDKGIHLDHNWIEGGLFISHEDFEGLDEFRQEFLEEIGK